MDLSRAIEYLNNCLKEAKSDEWRDGVKFALSLITDSIVRCKNCKEYNFRDNRVESEQCYVCDYWNREDLTDSDFCSRGKNKNSNDD